MKQSVLSVEVQECDTRCVEFLDGLRNLEIQMNSLDLQVKTVSSAEMDNSLRFVLFGACQSVIQNRSNRIGLKDNREGTY